MILPPAPGTCRPDSGSHRYVKRQQDSSRLPDAQQTSRWPERHSPSIVLSECIPAHGAVTRRHTYKQARSAQALEGCGVANALNDFGAPQGAPDEEVGCLQCAKSGSVRRQITHCTEKTGMPHLGSRQLSWPLAETCKHALCVHHVCNCAPWCSQRTCNKTPLPPSP